MIQAIGLTSGCRRHDGHAVVDDLTFEVPSGSVTGLLGPPGAGKTQTLALMLELAAGRGVTFYDGCRLGRLGNSARQVGAVLGDTAVHPGRTARGQLRMLAAAAGVADSRVDEVLELVGLTGVGGERLAYFSRGMERRLAVAGALIADPSSLLLDQPTDDLSGRDAAWVHSLLRAFAAAGGSVLVTGRDPVQMAGLADHLVSIDRGRLVADQPVAEFARTRLRPSVVVRSPQARRLADLMAADGAEVAPDGGSRVVVFGAACSRVGETAFRHGILLHELADQVVDPGPTPPLARADGRAAGGGHASPPRAVIEPDSARPGPIRPLRYEWRRLASVQSTWLITGLVLLVDAAVAFVLGDSVLGDAGSEDVRRLLTAWAPGLPVPPAAVGACLLGALACGHELRYPSLAPARGCPERRLGLLSGQLLVIAGWSVLLALATVALDAAVVRQALAPHGPFALSDAVWPLVSLAGLTVGYAWIGLLATGAGSYLSSFLRRDYAWSRFILKRHDKASIVR